MRPEVHGPQAAVDKCSIDASRPLYVRAAVSGALGWRCIACISTWSTPYSNKKEVVKAVR